MTFGGYLTPAIAGYHVLGATFDRVSDWSNEKWREIQADGHERNLDVIKNRIPSLSDLLATSRKRGWSGLRVTTRDRLPLIGRSRPDCLWMACVNSFREKMDMSRQLISAWTLYAYGLARLFDRTFGWRDFG